jgi:hypothetical protein
MVYKAPPPLVLIGEGVGGASHRATRDGKIDEAARALRAHRRVLHSDFRRIPMAVLHILLETREVGRVALNQQSAPTQALLNRKGIGKRDAVEAADLDERGNHRYTRCNSEQPWNESFVLFPLRL